MRICTWNVNSVRIHVSHVERLLEEQQPDLLCLQEIKVVNELFPAGLGEALGYKHRLIHGQKAYHGVAARPQPRPPEGGSDQPHLSGPV
jgi:exodeoxyribonuclease-3